MTEEKKAELKFMLDEYSPVKRTEFIKIQNHIKVLEKAILILASGDNYLEGIKRSFEEAQKHDGLPAMKGDGKYELF